MGIFDFLKSRTPPPRPRLRSFTDQDVRPSSATSVDSGQNSEHGAVSSSSSVRPGEDCGAALWEAAQIGDVAAARTLLERGANPNHPVGPKRATALILAAQKGHDDVIRALISRGAEIDTHNTDGVTAVFMAALNGRVSSIRLLARHGARLDFKTNKEGWTPLMGAVVNDHSEAVRALLELGADSRARNSLGKTAEEMAAQHPKIAALFAAHTQTAPRTEDAREARFRALEAHGNAVYFWGRSDPAFEQAFRALLAALADQDAEIRNVAAAQLGNSPDAVKGLLSRYQALLGTNPRQAVLLGRVAGRKLCKGKPEPVSEDIVAEFHGHRVAFVPYTCPHCGVWNLGIPVRTRWLTFYSEKSATACPRGLPVLCDGCGKEFGLCWD